MQPLSRDHLVEDFAVIIPAVPERVTVQPAFTVMIPVHNEAGKISAALNVLTPYLRGLSDSYSILLIENGSTDKTAQEVSNAVTDHKNTECVILPKASLGNALCQGIRQAKSEYLIYLPIDLSVSLDFVRDSLSLLATNDIVVGSKRLHKATDHRPIARRAMSVSYHLLTRILLRTKITDTTCVKAYRRSRVLPLLDEIRLYGIFETELLVRAERAGLKIVERRIHVSDRRLPRENLWMKILRKLEGILTLKLLLMLRTS
jgi:glycosyltransferase involved in cell wall biosynthesis